MGRTGITIDEDGSNWSGSKYHGDRREILEVGESMSVNELILRGDEYWQSDEREWLTQRLARELLVGFEVKSDLRMHAEEYKGCSLLAEAEELKDKWLGEHKKDRQEFMGEQGKIYERELAEGLMERGFQNWTEAEREIMVHCLADEIDFGREEASDLYLYAENHFDSGLLEAAKNVLDRREDLFWDEDYLNEPDVDMLLDGGHKKWGSREREFVVNELADEMYQRAVGKGEEPLGISRLREYVEEHGLIEMLDEANEMVQESLKEDKRFEKERDGLETDAEDGLGDDYWQEKERELAEQNRKPTKAEFDEVWDEMEDRENDYWREYEELDPDRDLKHLSLEGELEYAREQGDEIRVKELEWRLYGQYMTDWGEENNIEDWSGMEEERVGRRVIGKNDKERIRVLSNLPQEELQLMVSSEWSKDWDERDDHLIYLLEQAVVMRGIREKGSGRFVFKQGSEIRPVRNEKGLIVGWKSNVTLRKGEKEKLGDSPNRRLVEQTKGDRLKMTKSSYVHRNQVRDYKNRGERSAIDEGLEEWGANNGKNHDVEEIQQEREKRHWNERRRGARYLKDERYDRLVKELNSRKREIITNGFEGDLSTARDVMAKRLYGVGWLSLGTLKEFANASIWDTYGTYKLNKVKEIIEERAIRLAKQWEIAMLEENWRKSIFVEAEHNKGQPLGKFERQGVGRELDRWLKGERRLGLVPIKTENRKWRGGYKRNDAEEWRRKRENEDRRDLRKPVREVDSNFEEPRKLIRRKEWHATDSWLRHNAPIRTSGPKILR